MNQLYLRKSSSTFTAHSTGRDYHALVELGQTLVGYGNFYIESGTRVPTREEQLLLPPLSVKAPRRSRKTEILESI